MGIGFAVEPPVYWMLKPGIRSEEMKQMLNAIARLLVAAATGRAEQVARTLEDTRLGQKEVYSGNAGGWN
jgi:hypothetical protein